MADVGRSWARGSSRKPISRLRRRRVHGGRAGSRTTGRCSGSYRWSRLWGTYEGFYRDDNGQSDPGIGSLFDFPTNDPSYTAIGVPQFGYRGDVRLPVVSARDRCRLIVRIR